MKLKFLLPATAQLLLLIAALPTARPVSAQAPHRVEVTAKRFDFTPAEITLKKGEPAVLVLTSADVPHGVRFKEFGVEVKAGKGQTGEVSFTPGKTGTFVGHCSVFCGAGHGSMKLILHVVE